MIKNIEYETKVLDIIEEDLISKLRKIGAVEMEKYLSKQMIFDIQDENIKFVRIKQGKDTCTMTYKYKKLQSTEIGKTEEIEFVVSDFEKAKELLSKLGCFYRTMYQEKYVQKFYVDEIEFSICKWPRLKPFLEVEGADKASVVRGLELVGLSGKDIGDCDLAKLYKEKGIDMNSFPDLSF